MKALYFKVTDKLTSLKDIPLLFIRLVLAYGFYTPAMMKIKDVNSIAEWFKGSEMPLPVLSAYLVTYTEFLGFIFLALGFATRLISIPLIITMIVAIKVAHWENGFNASDNGYEIALYYLVMLILLLFTGPGRISIDYLIDRKVRK
jgi:putative oxidoreductase